MAKTIVPNRSHTEKIGGTNSVTNRDGEYAAEGVFAHGYFDSLSDGTKNASVSSLPALARSVAFAVSDPPKFLYASGKRQLSFEPGTVLVRADGSTVTPPDNIVLDFDTAAGTDYYVYLNDDGTFQISAVKVTDGSASIVGGFHTLCVSISANASYNNVHSEFQWHSLRGYVAGDILPSSVWCLNHRPYSEPEGMVFIDSLGFWCDIYLASGTGPDTRSAYKGVITVNRQIGDGIEDLFLVRKTLLTDEEFTAAMIGSPEQTSVKGATVGDGLAGGRISLAGTRMVSIYGVEEGCGLVYQCIRATVRAVKTAALSWPADTVEPMSGNKGTVLDASYVSAGGIPSDVSSVTRNFGSWCRVTSNASTGKYRPWTNVSAIIGFRGASRHVTQ